MNYKIINLNQLPLDIKGIIKSVKCEGNIKRRLLDIGMITGTNIIPVLKSPSGDPRAFIIRGSIIAIRSEEAEKIEVVVEI